MMNLVWRDGAKRKKKKLGLTNKERKAWARAYYREVFENAAAAAADATTDDYTPTTTSVDEDAT